MKFILASDIHSNLPALEAFFSYLTSHGLSGEPVFFLGDYVNLGPFPEETVSLLKTYPAQVFLSGNHDRYIINEHALDHNPYFGSPEGVTHCRWTREQLSPQSIEWLKNLHTRHRFEALSWKCDLIHGRHGSDEETLDESKIDTTSRILYICGHTHVPRNQTVGKARIFNPGSLGKPLDRDNRASFGIVHLTEDDATFEIVRIPYDIERSVKALEDRKVPWRGGIIQSLRTAVYTDEE
ncbi:MAG: metallophosphoesterase family protein [Spirochaetales bacterium]|nr:metallophosphoesterase family protein [Spirochaetales bacterium]